MAAQGKPGSDMRIVIAGTLAPASSGWWHDLFLGGSRPGVHVQLLQGRRYRWDEWQEIQRVNPLARDFLELRAALKREREKDRRDPGAKARFLSFRLNIPSSDEREMLLTVDDWDRLCSRPVLASEGQPLMAIDMGANRAWSASSVVWESGRLECLAVCAEIPSIRDQEVRDCVPAGSYSTLVDLGLLRPMEGKRVPGADDLIQEVVSRWGYPSFMFSDYLRIGS